MENKLIKTDNYLLLVDDSEIKEDCIAIHLGPLGEQEIVTANGECKLDKKIIAHLPLNNSPIFEGVPLLPPLEIIVDALCPYPESMQNAVDWHNGYNKAKEKYKYTEEDMLVIRNQLVTMLPTGDISAWDMIQSISKYTKWFDEYIESLSQPKIPVGFDVDYPFVALQGKNVIKTTTNSQGQTVWVGKYIY